MPISEQDVLTKLDELKVAEVKAAFASLKIQGPKLNDADANTILLHFLASEEETKNKLSLIKHLFCIDQESEKELFQIMSFLLHSHRSKLEFGFEMDYNTNALVCNIKSTVVSANEVALCHLALYLASQQVVSWPILEILLHAAYGRSLAITKRREAVKYIQQIDLTPYAYLMDHTFSCLLNSKVDDLRRGTPIENLFSVMNNHVEGTCCWSFFVMLCDKIKDEDIFYTLDKKNKTISFTHKNKNFTYEVKSNDIFIRLVSFQPERIFCQSNFKPAMPPENLKIIAKAFHHTDEEHFVECMEMLKKLSIDDLKFYAKRFHEIKDLQKMINKELRSRQTNDSLTELKNRFKYFVFLERYHTQYPERSIKSQDIQRDLAIDYTKIILPTNLQQIIDESLEYLQTKELISLNRYKLFKATHKIPGMADSDDEDPQVLIESSSNLKKRVDELANKVKHSTLALSVDELLTLNKRLIPYPELRKFLKDICVTKYRLEMDNQSPKTCTA